MSAVKRLYTSYGILPVVGFMLSCMAGGYSTALGVEVQGQTGSDRFSNPQEVRPPKGTRTTGNTNPLVPDETIAQSEKTSDDAHPIEEITVVATRTPISAFTFPGMVTSIQDDKLSRLNTVSSSDVFFYVPGVDVQGGARINGQQPALRGMGGADIVVTIDGARQDWIYGHEGRYLLDPMLLKQVDVWRGPASAMYGTGGIGGVIAFQTLDPEDLLSYGSKVGVRVTTGGQSVYDQTSQGIGLAIRPDETLSMLMYLLDRESGPIRTGGGVRIESDSSVRSGLFKTRYHKDDISINLGWIHLTDLATEPKNPQVGIASNGTTIVDRSYVTDQLTAEAIWDPKNNPWVNVHVNAYQIHMRHRELGLNADTNSDRKLTTTGMSIFNRSTYALSDTYSGQTNVGFEVFRDAFQVESFTNTMGASAMSPGSSTVFGMYIQDDSRWLKPLGLPGQLTLSKGLRFDQYTNERDFRATNSAQAISPRIGLNYAPVKWGFLFANVGRAFRAPTLTELYADGIHYRMGPVIVNNFVPNPDLKPQYALTYEGGAGLTFSNVIQDADRIRVKASTYMSRVKDLITIQVDQPTITDPSCFYRPTPSCSRFDGTTQLVNAGHAELKGFELETQYDSERYYLVGNLWTVSGKDVDTGASVGVLAPVIGRIEFGHRFFDRALSLGGRATFASKYTKGTIRDSSTHDPAQDRAGYGTFDVYAVIVPKLEAFEGLRFDLGIDNIFDKTYQRIIANAREPGRNFKALVTYSFTM